MNKAVFLFCFWLSGCQKCDGEMVITGYFYSPTTVGNVTVMQQYPIYECRKKESKK